MSTKTILIAAGGTGGHVFPGLALAKEFERSGFQVEWLGTESGLESRLVPVKGIKLHFFPVFGVRGKSILEKIAAPFRMLISLFVAIGILRRIRPSLVVGMGGFVAGPAGLAAYLLRIPLAIHEQNAVPGSTNKILSKISRFTFTAFPVSLTNAEVVGNPVRLVLEELGEGEKPQNENPKQVNVLVLGGSRGAKALNTRLAEAFNQEFDDIQLSIHHQCGSGREQETQDAYANTDLKVKIMPFIHDMDKEMSWADFMVCRAGALTVSELAIVGLPAILVPYPYAIDDHQTENARYLEKAGAAIVVQETEFESGLIDSAIKQIMSDRSVFVSMGKKARAAAMCGAAGKIVSRCKEVL